MILCCVIDQESLIPKRETITAEMESIDHMMQELAHMTLLIRAQNQEVNILQELGI